MLKKIKRFLQNSLEAQYVAGVIAALLLMLAVINLWPHKNDIGSTSVMITNRAKNSGGTGIILASTTANSSILTNDHVCQVVKKGGVVISTRGEFQVASILESEVSDLCLITVLGDLGVNTKLSNTIPKNYEEAKVSGHPALMPNVISKGHFSGRAILQVLVGMKKCTPKDMEDPNNLFVCVFFGGLPIVRSFESQLVSATIMPGSSGSGVYNSNNELSGVVFAGSQGFGYAWIVPYEQVLNFLYSEHTHLKPQVINQEINIMGKSDDEAKMSDMLKKCNIAIMEPIASYCDIIRHDMLWRK